MVAPFILLEISKWIAKCTEDIGQRVVKDDASEQIGLAIHGCGRDSPAGTIGPKHQQGLRRKTCLYNVPAACQQVFHSLRLLESPRIIVPCRPALATSSNMRDSEPDASIH
jgi:hypothetical protein